MCSREVGVGWARVTAVRGLSAGYKFRVDLMEFNVEMWCEWEKQQNGSWAWCLKSVMCGGSARGTVLWVTSQGLD